MPPAASGQQVESFVADVFPSQSEKVSESDLHQSRQLESRILKLNFTRLSEAKIVLNPLVKGVLGNLKFLAAQKIENDFGVAVVSCIASGSGSKSEKRDQCSFDVIPQFCENKSAICFQEAVFFLTSNALRKGEDRSSFSEGTLLQSLFFITKSFNYGFWFTLFAPFMPLGVRGVPAMFAMTAFDGIVVVAAIVLLVLALKSGFWTEKKMLVALLAVVAAGSVLGACYWTFLGTGYNYFGQSAGVPNLPRLAVDIVGRMMQVVFFGVVAAFAWVLVAAVLETFYPERTVMPKVVLAVFVGITLAAIAYSVQWRWFSLIPAEVGTALPRH